MAVISPCLSSNEKKHWWLSNRKIVDKYVKDARSLIATQEPGEIAAALGLLDAALALQPRLEPALELKARSLLCLRRFKDVADMLQDYIPSLKMASDDSDSDNSSSQSLSRDRVKLLHSEARECPSFKCFSVSDLKKKVLAGLCKNCDKEGQWRYLVLGQACCHLGLMEDAMALLQTGKRLATAAFRRESVCWSDDSFSLSDLTETASAANSASSSSSSSSPPRAASEFDTITQLLSHIKLLIRRRTAALAALDAGLYSESIRHFTKILDGRRAAPQGFLAECYVHRAAAFRSAGRIAESIADCNRTLSLDPSSIQALETRASLFETIRCLTDSLHDLEHLKLLYNAILRDRKLPGPAWKRLNVRYREIPGKLCALAARINALKARVASGETGNVDYYALIGLRRGCSRSELERAYLLLCLKHKPDKATGFIERCEVGDDRDLDSIRDRAKMSALLLYRLVQKAHASVTAAIADEEVAEQRRAIAAAIQAQREAEAESESAGLGSESETQVSSPKTAPSNNNNNKASAFQGVFCRDLAVVGNLLSQVGFNRPIPVKYEALSC